MSGKQSRAVTLLLCLSVLGVLLAGCGGSWTEFSSADGAFSVLMPGTPTEQTQTQDTDWGPIEVHMFTVEQGDVAYLAGYNVFPAAVIQAVSPAQLLDSARDGQVETVKGSLLSEEVITLDANPGRDLEIQVEDEDGISSLRSRLFLVGDRLYQLVVAGPEGQSTSSNTIKFLDSFELAGE